MSLECAPNGSRQDVPAFRNRRNGVRGHVGGSHSLSTSIVNAGYLQCCLCCCSLLSGAQCAPDSLASQPVRDFFARRPELQVVSAVFTTFVVTTQKPLSTLRLTAPESVASLYAGQADKEQSRRLEAHANHDFPCVLRSNSAFKR